MTTHNTGNPIGSSSVKDLYDNAENLDVFVNSKTATTHPDRLGVGRKTWNGIEQEAQNVLSDAEAIRDEIELVKVSAESIRDAIGFLVPVDYMPGLDVDTPNFTVEYDGVVYAAQPSAVPFTTSAWYDAQWYPVQNVLNQKNLLIFDTYAEASAAAATLPEGQSIQVNSDETKEGRITRYLVQAGLLSYQGLGFNAESTKFTAAGIGAVERTAAAELRDRVSVKQFGAMGDGVTDDTAAIQAAVTHAVQNDKAVWLVDGEYKITAPISITSQVAILGDGQAVSRLLCVNCNAFTVSAGVGFVTMIGFTIAHASRYTITPNSNTAINVLGTTAAQCYWHTYRDLFIDGFEVAFNAGGVCSSRWNSVTTVYTHQSVNFSAQCLNNSISQCSFGEQLDSAAGSYGIKVGDGLINCEGLLISDSLIYGVRRGICVNASINVVAHHNIIDMVREFGILSKSTASAGCINNIFSNNYIGVTGPGGDSAIYLVNAYTPADSQNRGTIVRDNEILAYLGSALNYGILVDGAEEKRNLISGNRVQNTTVYDCRIAAGSGHRISDNLWRSASGFSTTVAGVSYINNVGNIAAAYPSPIGDFTPVVTGTSSAGVGTYSQQIGRYKIIDKMVHFNLRLAWSKHTGTGDLRISGLPAPSKNVPGYAPAVTVNSEDLTFPSGASAIIGLVNTGASTIELRGAGNAIAPTPVAIDTAAAVNISGFYEID